MKTTIAAISLIIAVLLTSCGGKGVHGKVTDGETGKPVAGAAVELDNDFAAKTDTTATTVFQRRRRAITFSASFGTILRTALEFNLTRPSVPLTIS